MLAVPLLSLLVLLPLGGGLLALACGTRLRAARGAALVVSLVELALVGGLLAWAESPATGQGAWLLSESRAWLPALGIGYRLGLDGVSLLLVLLTALLQVLCVLVSWRQIEDRPGLYYFLLLVMQTGVNGLFLAQDLFLFYLFWELQLIPMFFLVGIWGHERRIYASFKLVLFTLAGSLMLLLGILGLYAAHGAQTGEYTFSLAALASAPPAAGIQTWLMAAMLIGFAVKVPLVPLHTWLPEAHTQAPTAGSVLLAGVLLKTGAYAIFRVALPLLPSAASLAAPVLIGLALAGVFYAAWIARAQEDLKRLVAYSSITHLGLVVLGLAAWDLLSVSGAVLQMINHGLSTSALFIMAGLLQARLGTRRLADMGGLWGAMPRFSAFFLFFAMASLGLPGLNNFVGELLVLLGTYRVYPAAAVAGFVGLAVGVMYVLGMVQATIFGPAKPDASLPDLNAREALILGVLAAAVLFIGLHPGPVLELIEGPVRAMLHPGSQVALAVF
ncbi:MAG: NADH-quinone oxidoreductase subunit M [Deltaproteobacteria bacterium]|nr:NADH-quinone oxidoreductase subunit M [Deltaproteobacteria bacterium]